MQQFEQVLRQVGVIIKHLQDALELVGWGVGFAFVLDDDAEQGARPERNLHARADALLRNVVLGVRQIIEHAKQRRWYGDRENQVGDGSSISSHSEQMWSIRGGQYAANADGLQMPFPEPVWVIYRYSLAIQFFFGSMPGLKNPRLVSTG